LDLIAVEAAAFKEKVLDLTPEDVANKTLLNKLWLEKEDLTYRISEFDFGCIRLHPGHIVGIVLGTLLVLALII
jgi:hypothetical protein